MYQHRICDRFISFPRTAHDFDCKPPARGMLRATLLLYGALSIFQGAAAADPGSLSFADASGVARTLSVTGAFDESNPFFQPLGTNDRACATCHVPGTGWTVTPADIQARFQASGGLDPIFRTNDGSNSPLADVSTVAARLAAYSMLLDKGLVRIGLGMPGNPEFELLAIDDPYNYASATELSMFRRPLPSTNLTFLSTVMWDGRVTFAGTASNNNLRDNLKSQANGATIRHEQALPPTDAQLNQIVDFEISLFTAQTKDTVAGNLASDGGQGGPWALSQQIFFVGINDPFAADPLQNPFSASVFSIYDAWSDIYGGSVESLPVARGSIARGEAIFNTRPIMLTNVGGLNDEQNSDVIVGTCGTCHNAPNVGTHSTVRLFNLGIADASRRTADLPLYSFRNLTTHEVVQTSDPGRALITGKWKHLGQFKVPGLRGLAARPPYFHNGSAATLNDVVKFYNDRFAIGLLPEEQADLVNFLKTL